MVVEQAPSPSIPTEWSLARSRLREQPGFAGYRARRAIDPEVTVRRHSAERGGPIHG